MAPRLQKLANVQCWTDLLELDVADILAFGLGGIFQFMEEDMLRAYLPALLYFARSEPYPYANIVTNLVMERDFKTGTELFDRVMHLAKVWRG